MSASSWSSPLILTSICLIPFLVLSLIVAWRAKSGRAGLNMFLLFSSFIVALVFITWIFIIFIPKDIQNLIGNVVSFVSIGFIGLVAILYWINARRGGKLALQGVHPKFSISLIFGSIYILIWLVATGFFLTFAHEFFSEGFWIILTSAIITSRALLSFQIREKGFVSYGKLVKFEDIDHMEWTNLRDKKEVKIRFKNSEKPALLKIPWAFVTPVDDCIKDYIPRT